MTSLLNDQFDCLIMNFLKVLFGSGDQSPEEEKQNEDARHFDLLKYDGVKAMKMGRPDYAVKCFQEALRMNEDLEVRDYLSRAFVTQGEYEQALEQLHLLMDAQPDNKGLPMQAAHVANLMDDYDRMQQYCEQSLAIDPENATAHFLYARACLGRNDLVGTIARLTRCIALNESFGDAYLLRGQTLLQMGDVAGAEADAEWLMEHAEHHEDILMLVARIARAKGNNDDALTVYTQVIDLNPFHVEAFRERGQLRFDMGDKQGAKEDMEKVLELCPEEMTGVNGDYTAEGIEQQVRRAYSALNPFGI